MTAFSRGNVIKWGGQRHMHVQRSCSCHCCFEITQLTCHDKIQAMSLYALNVRIFHVRHVILSHKRFMHRVSLSHHSASSSPPYMNATRINDLVPLTTHSQQPNDNIAV